MRLKKNNVYLVRIVEEARMLLEELEILGEDFTFIRTISPTIISGHCCKRAYLRGAFLGGGSINHPDSPSYHLEIFSLYEEHNASLCELMNEFGLNAKILERKKGFITYMKESEK